MLRSGHKYFINFHSLLTPSLHQTTRSFSGIYNSLHCLAACWLTVATQLRNTVSCPRRHHWLNDEQKTVTQATQPTTSRDCLTTTAAAVTVVREEFLRKGHFGAALNCISKRKAKRTVEKLKNETKSNKTKEISFPFFILFKQLA